MVLGLMDRATRLKYDAVIFDLDGTLIDSLEDIASAINYALAKLGRSTFETQRFKTIAGGGNRMCFKRALGTDDPELISRAVALKLAYEKEHGHPHSKPYEGIDAMLRRLKEKGIRMAVLSNKTEHAVKSVVDKGFRESEMFEQVVGAREDTPLKPDPTAAKRIVQRLRVDPTRCVYIGDTDVDMKTGKAAGLFTVGVTWGFRTAHELKTNGADAIVNTPSDIIELLL